MQKVFFEDPHADPDYPPEPPLMEAALKCMQESDIEIRPRGYGLITIEHPRSYMLTPKQTHYLIKALQEALQCAGEYDERK